MTNHVFKISLGRKHSEMLDRIAEFTSHDDDLKGYVRTLLLQSIESTNDWVSAQLYECYRHEIAVLSEIYRRNHEQNAREYRKAKNQSFDKDIDDGIPF